MMMWVLAAQTVTRDGHRSVNNIEEDTLTWTPPVSCKEDTGGGPGNITTATKLSKNNCKC